jgi:methionyl-tRNA synthetase
MQGPPICKACRDKLEEKFQEVKSYIWENPKSTVEQIAEDNDVTIKQIKQWIREERLTFTNDSPITIECEKCGKGIKSGRFCPECKQRLANRLTDSIAPEEIPIEQPKKAGRDRERMRFLDQ